MFKVWRLYKINIIFFTIHTTFKFEFEQDFDIDVSLEICIVKINKQKI